MKKLVSCALVLSMALGLAGCGSKGGYASTEKKVIKAAEDCCGAEEATKKQKKIIVSDRFSPTDDSFEDGVYISLTSDDIEDMDFGRSGLDAEDMPQMLLFVKSEDESYLMTYVVEAADKEAAEELYEYFADNFGTSEKQLKKDAKKHDAEYGFDEDDSKLTIIMSSESEDRVKGVDIRINGKVVSICIFEGAYESDLTDEYFEFSPAAGFADLDALLEG